MSNKFKLSPQVESHATCWDCGESYSDSWAACPYCARDGRVSVRRPTIDEQLDDPRHGQAQELNRR